MLDGPSSATPKGLSYDLEPYSERLWEEYNENSKLTRYQKTVPDEIVLEEMKRSTGVTDYQSSCVIHIAGDAVHESDDKLSKLLTERRSVIPAVKAPLRSEKFGRILSRACGVTATQNHAGVQRPFRAYPSAGALYPIDIYAISLGVTDLRDGLYYYDIPHACLRRLERADIGGRLQSAIVQKDVLNTCVVLFAFVACCQRTCFKYGERGYRFALLEAGHIAQNLSLSSAADARSYLCLGGYFDQEVERLIGLDGVSQTVVYMSALF